MLTTLLFFRMFTEFPPYQLWSVNILCGRLEPRVTHSHAAEVKVMRGCALPLPPPPPSSPLLQRLRVSISWKVWMSSCKLDLHHLGYHWPLHSGIPSVWDVETSLYLFACCRTENTLHASWLLLTKEHSAISIQELKSVRLLPQLSIWCQQKCSSLEHYLVFFSASCSEKIFFYWKICFQWSLRIWFPTLCNKPL